MLRGLFAIAVLVFLAGCAQSPLEIQQTGRRTETRSQSAPLVAAHCVIREVESMAFGVGAKATVSLRPLVQPNTYELIVHVGGTLGVVLVSPVADEGSSITIWRNSATPLIGASQLDGAAKRC